MILRHCLATYEADLLLKRSHRHGLKIVLELVPFVAIALMEWVGLPRDLVRFQCNHLVISRSHNDGARLRD